MNKKYLSKVVAIVVSMMLSVSFVGCNKTEKTTSKSGEEVGGNFNPTGYPIVNEEITIRAFTQIDPQSKDFNEMKILKDLKEKTGINVVYECISGSIWNEKKNLVLASNELPDIFLGGGLSDSDVIKYGSQGVFIPLEDWIDQYAVNIKKVFEEDPSVKKSCTAADGHIYTLPYVDGYEPEDVTNHMFINKTWLEKLGLSVPTTTDEFYDVLKAFKEKDPNGNGEKDEIPFTYRVGNVYNGDFSLSGAFGVLDGPEHVMIKDNKMVFSPMEEGYKEYIQWTQKLYSEGLIDKEIFTQDQGQYLAKGKMDVVGGFVIYSSDNMVGEERADKDFTVLQPLEGPNGDRLWGRYVKGIRPHKVAITKENQNVEATIRWIDEFFDEEFGVESHLGEIGKVILKEGDKYKVATPPEGVTAAQFKFENSAGPFAPGIVSKEVYRNCLIQNKSAERKTKAYELYDEFATQSPLPIMSFTNAQLNEIATIKADIDTYVEEMKAKWITGQSNIEKDWEDYKNTLKKMQVDRYVELYQEAYDLYQKQ